MSAIEKIPFENAELLRFITCGSVDDGKSTLIGRLLFDSKGLFEDTLGAVARSSAKRGMEFDLSLITDGLQAEREQGITIDVAYRYFATPRRKFIIADTPGHEQYTRNMVTGASTANLAIILIDARKGMQTQSRRHAYLAALLGIPHLIVAVNKMDLVNYDQAVFNAIRDDFAAFAVKLGLRDVKFIPLSAINGDMVVTRGGNLAWYDGEPLLTVLESIDIEHDVNENDFRFPVQLASRPDDGSGGRRRYLGRIPSGSIRVGDAITVLPVGLKSRIAAIDTFDGPLNEAFAGQSVSLQIEDQIDIGRGDMIVKTEQAPEARKEFAAELCWFSEQPLDPKKRYLIKHTTRTVKALLSGIEHRVDVNTLERFGADKLAMNDIARVKIKTQMPLLLDGYKTNRATGSFIVIDEATNNTVAAGMVS